MGYVGFNDCNAIRRNHEHQAIHHNYFSAGIISLIRFVNHRLRARTAACSNGYANSHGQAGAHINKHGRADSNTNSAAICSRNTDSSNRFISKHG